MAAREAARTERLLHSKRKVLVVDDGLINRVVLCQILKRQGIEVLECTTGLEAVQAFKQHGLAWPGSLLCILMDINMPHMDGLEAAQRIRQLEAQAAGGKLRRDAGEPAAQGSADLERSLRHSSCSHTGAHRRIPIWAVSACSESEQLCSPALAHLPAELHAGPPWRLAGIDAFMSKPINSHHLTEMLACLEADLSARQHQQCLPANVPTSEAEVRRWPGERQAAKRSLGPGCLDGAPVAKRLHASLEGLAAEHTDQAEAHASDASLFGGTLITPSDSDPEAGAVPALPSDRLTGRAVALLVPDDGAMQAAGPQDYSDEESP